MNEKKLSWENRKDPRQIKFRVNEDEHLYLSALAEQRGLSLSQFCKNVAMGKQYKRLMFDHADALMIRGELRRYGANLNQIARWCNTQKGNMAAIEKIEEILARIKEIEKGVNQKWEQL